MTFNTASDTRLRGKHRRGDAERGRRGETAKARLGRERGEKGKEEEARRDGTSATFIYAPNPNVVDTPSMARLKRRASTLQKSEGYEK